MTSLDLFPGDLQVRYSPFYFIQPISSDTVGHSPVAPPIAVDTRSIIYIAGDCLCSITELENGTREERILTHTNSSITAFAYCAREQVIAYAEASSAQIHFIKWPTGETYQSQLSIYQGLTFAEDLTLVSVQ
jgi:hypothetical protein